MSEPAAPTMLEYYVKAGISPVSQDISDLDRHLQRRGALYQSLGLFPALLRKAEVLEVGPGSGHNSLYVAGLKPPAYTLVEPNPTAGREIAALYDAHPRPHTRPEIVARTLQDFAPDRQYDVVICEGWLGSSAQERAMLTKLGQLTRPGGVLVTTLISPLGLVFNTLRKALCLRLSSPDDAIAARLERVAPAFSPHLSTLAHMSRPHRDWMLDMVLSPAYFGICLTPEMAVEALGPQFDPVGTQPRFLKDWRWYKALFGENRAFGEVFLQSYRAACLNFLDYRRTFPDLADPSKAEPLIMAAERLLDATRDWERGHAAQGFACPPPVLEATAMLGRELEPLDAELAAGVKEAEALLRRPALDPETVGAMTAFAPLFGRELIYTAFVRGE
jgi:SAM-dependent methyltransferase